MAIPILALLSQSVTLDASVWGRLWERRIPRLFVNSLLLVITVTMGSLLLGSLLAFFVQRTNLPGRNVFRSLLVAPLITPCYIIAICYVNFFGVKGVGEKLLTTVGFDCRLPGIYGFWGAAAILIIGTYPYVYTIVLATLARMDPRYSEMARCLGAGRIERLYRVWLPLLQPALAAGGILVALYVLSDFGVVSLVRYKTFVNVIYEQMSGRYDYGTAAALSAVLLGITLLLFILQEYVGRKRAFISTENKGYVMPLINLRWYKWPALTLTMAVLFCGLLIPLGVLIYWFIQSLAVNTSQLVWKSDALALLQSGWNSLSLSALAATAAVVLALPLAYWSARKSKSPYAGAITWISQSGIALPGVLIALSLSLVFSSVAPKLSFSLLALFLAFLVHFFAQSFQSTRTGLAQVSPKFEEDARLLGCTPLRTFCTVSLPLLKPSLLAAWTLVFLSSMRELPASLLLRPAGFDPLTVKVWNAASEGFYEASAAPALLVVMLSLPILFIITRNQAPQQTLEAH